MSNIKPTEQQEWEWDAEYALVKDKVFELSGPNNSIATKIDQDLNAHNCMVVGCVMETGTGKHTIAMKLVQGSKCPMYTICGVVRDGAPCNQFHFDRESTVGWFMNSDNGGLYGNGKCYDDEAGRIEPGQVLIMQVDTDAGTLKFIVDGKLHGPGYTSGVTGLLRWAICVINKKDSVEIFA